MRHPAAYCGLVLLGILPWGQTLNPMTFCKESTFPQKRMNVLCPQVSPVLWVYPPQCPAELFPSEPAQSAV